MIRQAAHKFARQVLRPMVPELERNKRMSPELLDDIFQNGFMGVEVPEQYGGVGGSFKDSLDVVEEFSMVDPSVSLMLDIQNTLIHQIMHRYADQEQKERFWPDLATRSVGCFALSESSSGSDAFALRCTATEDGSDYVLNGEKMWISNSDHGQLFFVFAKRKGSVQASTEPPYRSVDCFVVPRDTIGLEVASPENKLGLWSSGTCAVSLSDCRIPKENKLPHPGYRIAIEALNAGRIGIAAQMIGITKGALEITLPILRERKQFGQPIYEFQSVRHRYAHLVAQLQATEALMDRAVQKMENQEPFLIEASSVKYLSARLAQETTSQCIDLVGGIGFTEDLGLAKLYRDCKVGTIYEGTENIQLETISKNI